MYNIEHEILKQLSKFETVIDDTCKPTLDELKQIRNKIHRGLAFCKELYKKTGSVKEAVIFYNLLYTTIESYCNYDKLRNC